MVTMILLSLTGLTAHAMYSLQVLTYNFSLFLFCTICHSFLQKKKIMHFVLITFELHLHHCHTTLMPYMKCCCPPFSPHPGPYTTVVGLAVTPLQQTHPSVFLLSPSTHLHRHKHGTTLATVYHLKETVTMVGVPRIIYLILCFRKLQYMENVPCG